MNNIEKIGWTLRRMRQNRKMSQQIIADLAGLDRTYISNIENGRANFSMDAFLRITKALDASPSSLLKRALED